MRLSEGQMQRLREAARRPPGRRAARDPAAVEHVGIGVTAEVTKERPRRFTDDVMWASERVMRAADNVIRVAQDIAPAIEPGGAPVAAEIVGTRGGGPFDRIATGQLSASADDVPSRRRISAGFLVFAYVVLVVSGGAAVSLFAAGNFSPSPSGPAVEPGAATAFSRRGAQTAASAASGWVDQSLEWGPSARAPSARSQTGAGANAVEATGMTVQVPGAGPPSTVPPTNAEWSSSGPAERQSVAISAAVATSGPATAPALLNQETTPGPDTRGSAVARAVASRAGAPGDTAAAQGASDGQAACLAARPPGLQLPIEDTERLRKVGEEFMGQGRVSAARLVFQRAADACDMQAAFALGATYDPLRSPRSGMALLAPDIAAARAWYERARSLGSAEATRQLERLSGRDR